MIARIYKSLKYRISNLLTEVRYPKTLRYGEFEFKFRYSALNSGMKKYILDNINSYEAGERLLIEKIIAKGDIVVEAGTSTGILTGLISKLIGETGKVITVEADNNLVEIARSINRESKNIRFINGAIVFNDSKKIRFSTDGWLGGHISDKADDQLSNIVEVPAYNLLELVNDNNCNFLVLDIEGEEQNLLHAGLPSTVSKIVIEYHPDIYGAGMLKQLNEKIVLQGFQEIGCYGNVFAYTKIK